VDASLPGRKRHPGVHRHCGKRTPRSAAGPWGAAAYGYRVPCQPPWQSSSKGVPKGVNHRELSFPSSGDGCQMVVKKGGIRVPFCDTDRPRVRARARPPSWSARIRKLKLNKSLWQKPRRWSGRARPTSCSEDQFLGPFGVTRKRRFLNQARSLVSSRQRPNSGMLPNSRGDAT
jgi:hypothetical protein